MTATRRLTFVAIAAALAVSGQLSAQPPAKEEKARPVAPVPPLSDFQVIPLKHSNSADVAQVLQNAFGASNYRIVFDLATNSLLIAAPGDEVGKIREIIAKLDVARPDTEVSRPQLRVFQLRHIPADKILQDALKLLLGNRGPTFSMDSRQNYVVVHADEQAIKNVEALLAKLDQPTATRPSSDAMVRVLWLVGGLEDAAAPPDDIKDVLPTLAKLGVDKPRLAAQTVVNVAPGAEFQANGTAKLDGPCQFSVTGRLDQAGDAPQLQVTIRATRAAPAPPAGGGPGGPGGGRFGSGRGGPANSGEEIGHVQTTISAPPGHMVVLGVTPTNTVTSVFVVQVLRVEAKRAK